MWIPRWWAICGRGPRVGLTLAFMHAQIERLEAYVEEQVQTQTYDFAANKALLKLYQFFPDRSNEQTIATVLAKV